MTLSLVSSDLLLWLYLWAFGAAAAVTFLSLLRVRHIQDPDTKRGLAALLITSGAWSMTHLGYLAAPSPRLQYGFFLAGLVVGLSTVGPWLYFCSAYTGRSYHRNRLVRRLAIGTYLAIVAVKVTNPIHERYFTVETVSTPFPHLLIHHEPLHWVVMGLAYVLAFIGVFMLFELFVQVDFDTKPLLVIVSLTGLPVIVDVVGASTPWLLDITYSALGVAAFAIGVLFVYFDRFQTIQLSTDQDDPIIILDGDGEIRDVNVRAQSLFPALQNAFSEPFAEVVPTVANTLASADDILRIETDRGTRYFRVSETALTAVGERLGRSIHLTDVTEREQYRRELERQNGRLDRFASIVSHDLRNPLNVAAGRLEMVRERHPDDTDLAAVERALDRMEALIEDVLRLARLGQPIDDLVSVPVRETVAAAWEMVDSGTSNLEVTPELNDTVQADNQRLQQLFENLFRNAIEHGGRDVVVTVGSLETTPGFFVADDGAGIPPDARDRLFEFGYTTSSDGTGFGLAIVAEIVDAHGWSIQAVDAVNGGARFEIRTGRPDSDTTG